MSRHEAMSKWYPLSGYPYADVNRSNDIDEMLQKISKIAKTDVSEETKHTQICAHFEAITEIAFEHNFRYDAVISYISYLYSADEDAAAFDLALKLFHALTEMVNPNVDALESVCEWVEILADEADAMTDELDEQLTEAKSYIAYH